MCAGRGRLVWMGHQGLRVLPAVGGPATVHRSLAPARAASLVFGGPSPQGQGASRQAGGLSRAVPAVHPPVTSPAQPFHRPLSLKDRDRLSTMRHLPRCWRGPGRCLYAECLTARVRRLVDHGGRPNASHHRLTVFLHGIARGGKAGASPNEKIIGRCPGDAGGGVGSGIPLTRVSDVDELRTFSDGSSGLVRKL